jgi:dimethylamine/trimethylamine dehydrogenase
VQLSKLRNVQFVPNTELSATEIREYGAEIVIIATGSSWATDGLNPATRDVIPGADAAQPWCFTPEQIMRDGTEVPGETVVVYDTEGYFMGVSLADKFAREGKRVTIVTPFVLASPYTFNTGEGPRLNRMFHEVGVRVMTQHVVKRVSSGGAVVAHGYAPEHDIEVPADAVVLVTQRVSHDALYRELKSDCAALEAEGIELLLRIGDCVAPRMALADAIFDAHRTAREIDTDDPATPLPYIRENRVLGFGDEDYDAILGLEPERAFVPSSTRSGVKATTLAR